MLLIFKHERLTQFQTKPELTRLNSTYVQGEARYILFFCWSNYFNMSRPHIRRSMYVYTYTERTVLNEFGPESYRMVQHWNSIWSVSIVCWPVASDPSCLSGGKADQSWIGMFLYVLSAASLTQWQPILCVSKCQKIIVDIRNEAYIQY